MCEKEQKPETLPTTAIATSDTPRHDNLPSLTRQQVTQRLHQEKAPAHIRWRDIAHTHSHRSTDPRRNLRPRTRTHQAGMQTTRAGGAGARYGRRRGQHDPRGGGGHPNVYALVFYSSRYLTFSQTPRSKHPPRSCLLATTAISWDSRYVSLTSCLSAIC